MKNNTKEYYRLAAEAAHKCLQHYHRGVQQFKRHKLLLEKETAVKNTYPSTVWIYMATILSYGLIIAEMLVSYSTIQPITKNIFLSDTGWIHNFIVGLYGTILLVLALFIGKYLFVSPKQIQLKATLRSIALSDQLVPTLYDEVEKEIQHHKKYGYVALFFFVTIPALIYIYRIYAANEHSFGSLMSYIPMLIPLSMVVVITLLSSFKWVCTAHFTNWQAIRLSKKRLKENRKKCHQNALNCKQYLDTAEGLGLEFTHNAQVTETLKLLDTTDFASNVFFSDESLPRWIEIKLLEKGQPACQISVKAWTYDGTTLQLFTDEKGEVELSWKSAFPFLTAIIIQGKYRLDGDHFSHEQRLEIHLEELKTSNSFQAVSSTKATPPQNGMVIPITESS